MKQVVSIIISSLVFVSLCIAEVRPSVIGTLPIGKLAFVTSRYFGMEGTIMVTGEPAQFLYGDRPSFSADATKLVYALRLFGRSRMYIRDLKSGRVVAIDTKVDDPIHPSISPDGLHLAYHASPPNSGSAHIWVVSVDGSYRRQLTSGESYNWSPRWSPDGRSILFEATRDGHRQVYVMNSDGSNQMNLSRSDVLCHAPSWSPDGEYIAYMSRGGGRTASIFVMKRDGSGATNVSCGKTRDSEPVWSPDGEWIAFTRTVGDTSGNPIMDVWIMRRDGSDQRPFTKNLDKLSSYGIAWSY